MKKILFFWGILFALVSCRSNVEQASSLMETDSMSEKQNLDSATFGAGCFWCVETIFERLKGVYKVESGYMGGHKESPTYKEVCAGTTGHAEVITLKFDKDSIDYETLLKVFWSVHDPTTLNRQGGDVGTQYRSAVYYYSDEQKETALKVKDEIEKELLWSNPIVTEITEASTFYAAEDYHQDYYNQNSEQGYCQLVINPKVAKFKKKFAHLLR